MHKKFRHKKTIKKVLQFLKRYWALELLSLFFAAVSVILTLYLPILTGDAVDLIIGKGLVDFDGILRILIKMGIVIVLTALAQWR